ncbi:alpha/beta-Hydrolase [Sarocladium implicatum]|nr:alpha/beta-Hydrolase [Sarocladium implicatum]
MSRTLLLCFVHGFKGTDDSFHEFPGDLRRQLGKQLPDHSVKSVVYPKYETKGELAQASEAFLEWLKERVMDERKKTCENPWPPSDNKVGVVLVAHSMGGFVAADTLFLALNERASNPNSNDLLFPLIQGILTFDTPYNGLARSMFVYGAFSNYSKVNGVFNAMTALSAAAPATLSRLGTRSAATSAIPSAPRTSGGTSPAWTTWQLVAVRTGTVGAIAAGGVAAYTHREAIISGVKSVRNMNRDSIARGYRQSVDALGQGLAYINRGNVGKSFAWLSDHFTFVGALMKQKELNRRLERLGALKGVGLQDFYASLGENGYWSGGYFVPERTFCAVPEPDHGAYGFFTRRVMLDADDEIQAHLNMFRPAKHDGYENMVDDSAQLVKEWFLSESPVEDDPKFQESDDAVAEEDKEVEKVLEKGPEAATSSSADEKQGAEESADPSKAPEEVTQDELPDESPIDIAAAASLVPLPGSEDDLLGDASTEVEGSDKDGVTAEERQNAKRTYVQHLFEIAQSAGNEAKGWWPSTMPSMPKMPESVSSLSMPRVSVNPFASSASKKQKTGDGTEVGDEVAGDQKQGEAEKQQEQQEQQPSVSGETSEDATMTVEK